jgi:membrane protein implicated in regulation of membrane protease activity
MIRSSLFKRIALALLLAIILSIACIMIWEKLTPPHPKHGIGYACGLKTTTGSSPIPPCGYWGRVGFDLPILEFAIPIFWIVVFILISISNNLRRYINIPNPRIGHI